MREVIKKSLADLEAIKSQFKNYNYWQIADPTNAILSEKYSEVAGSKGKEKVNIKDFDTEIDRLIGEANFIGYQFLLLKYGNAKNGIGVTPVIALILQDNVTEDMPLVFPFGAGTGNGQIPTIIGLGNTGAGNQINEHLLSYLLKSKGLAGTPQNNNYPPELVAQLAAFQETIGAANVALKEKELELKAIQQLSDLRLEIERLRLQQEADANAKKSGLGAVVEQFAANPTPYINGFVSLVGMAVSAFTGQSIPAGATPVGQPSQPTEQQPQTKATWSDEGETEQNGQTNGAPTQEEPPEEDVMEIPLNGFSEQQASAVEDIAAEISANPDAALKLQEFLRTLKQQ